MIEKESHEIPFEQLDELYSAVLGNPYDARVRARRTALESEGLLPANRGEDLEFEQLEVWWARIPEWVRQLDDEVLLLPMALWLYEEASAKRRVKDLARILPEKKAERLIEIVVRSTAVKSRLDQIVGNSAAMERVRKDAWAASFGKDLRQAMQLTGLLQSTPVFIHGETGTGKELVAQAVLASVPGRWTKDGWKPAPAESLHLGAIPNELVRGELFGHSKGAFTGADRARTGILERCHEGGVFLDEVGDLPAQAQVGLLRALQEGKVRPLGAEKDIDARPRVISATHRDLPSDVRRNRFRLDLYHRLASSVRVEIPPLRERPDSDHEELVKRGLEDLGIPAGLESGALFEEIRAWIGEHRDYRWPGNVRELMAVVRAKALGVSPVTSDLEGEGRAEGEVPDQLLDGDWTLDELKHWYIGRVLEKHGDNATHAAAALGVNRSTVTRWRDREESE